MTNLTIKCELGLIAGNGAVAIQKLRGELATAAIEPGVCSREEKATVAAALTWLTVAQQALDQIYLPIFREVTPTSTQEFQ